MRKLDITKQVDNFLEKLQPKQCKQILGSILNLRKNCRPHDSIKLLGTEDQYRIDIGEFRIIYKFDDEVVYIQIVGKRNDGEVYKKIKQ